MEALLPTEVVEMRLSVKSRYALAAITQMGLEGNKNGNITMTFLSERLDISKIYLEQVFSLLKHSGIVSSTKGAQGGYQLAKSLEAISVYDILSAVEFSLFESTDPTVADSAPDIEKVLQDKVFKVLDEGVSEQLKKITLDSLVAKVEEYGGAYMYYL